MRYTLQIKIDRSIGEIGKLLHGSYKRKTWMPNLKSITAIQGQPGETNSRTKLIFQAGNRELIVIETITVNEFPDKIAGYYEMQGSVNHINNQFVDLNGKHTLLISEQCFELRGAKRLLAWVRPDIFRKQSMQHMEQFKKYIEGEIILTKD